MLARLSELSAWLTLHGTSSNPYDKSFSGIEIAPDNIVSPELQPYSDLDPGRLVLHGKGRWEVGDYLPDDLRMAFLEPRSILVATEAADRPLVRDDPSTIAALAKKWDMNGLLMVHEQPSDPKAFVRIFNARKSLEQDRQIGDIGGGPTGKKQRSLDLLQHCLQALTCVKSFVIHPIIVSTSRLQIGKIFIIRLPSVKKKHGETP